jgi:hypothetical protein
MVQKTLAEFGHRNRLERRNGGDVIMERKRPYAQFSDSGTRLANVELPASECYFQPGTGNVVALHYRDVALINPAGNTIRTITRRPDGNWLEQPQAVSLAPDGSIAILALPQVGHKNTATVNIYKAGGEPICTVTLGESAASFPRIAYDGRRLIVAGDRGLILFDGSGSPMQRSDVPLKVDKGMYYYPYLLPGGRELLLFDGKNPMLHRYELP